jgi:hypothetical protein
VPTQGYGSLDYHSYFTLNDHAILNYADQYLHLQPYHITLRLFGKRGMVWEEVEPKVHQLLSQFGHPDVIMLYCGGTALALSLRHLQKFMKVKIANIQNALPNSKIVWSQILPRNYYRHMFSHHAAEKARVRINSSLSNIIMSKNVYIIQT